MKTIIANWKMNGNVSLVHSFVREINAMTTANNVIICPPDVLIPFFGGFKCSIGAQNCFYEESGAFTGEISPKLLKEIGCEYVILGHSERRTIFGESDEIIFKKWAAAVSQKLIPVVCVGEKLEEKNDWKEILSRQLEKYSDSTDHCPETIFAYEPIWSVGTGITPEISEIETILEFLRSILCKSIKHRLLYGGSVTSANAEKILSIQNVDGLLVGGASLKIDEFKKIIQ